MSGKLQFLNLAGDGKTSRPVTVNCKISRHFSFTIPLDPDDKEKKRSRARNLHICNEIAARLRVKGFEVSNARPGKPRGAVVRVSSDKFEVVAILDANRLPR